MRFILLILFIFLSLNAFSFPIPKENKAIFDITRKNKVIGTHEINFIKDGYKIQLETTINIDVKVFFFPAYKFYHKSTETWSNDNFIKFDGYTDFEDEREYFIKGLVTKNKFEGTGMDGDIILEKDIIPSNLWNIKILEKKILFDIQKGISRAIKVQKLEDEEIVINNKKIKCKKFSFVASRHPKDKGPFPKYILWYDEKNELIKYQFKNYKDKKDIIVIRRYQDIN